MKKPNWATCNENELWNYIAYHLKQKGIDTILVGGAVVSIYSKGAYQSGDIDLVMVESVKEIEPILNELGFKKENRHFEHPECPHLFVEFVSPPAAIGDDYNIIPDEVKIGNMMLKILSPTDCIRDRLASYLFFDARECMDQAVLVANAQKFSHEKVKNWCANEGHPEIYEEFMSFLKK